jgi:hypothetical protein
VQFKCLTAYLSLRVDPLFILQVTTKLFQPSIWLSQKF